MRVVITGATGNLGTSLISELGNEPSVREIVGVSRRGSGTSSAKTRSVAANVATDDLSSLMEGADALVHLAWALRPERHEKSLEENNVAGSRRVLSSAAAAGVRIIVYASSVGAYSPAPKDRLIDESWPTEGVETAIYSRQKVAVERALDEAEAQHPEIRVVRLRPALIFKRTAGAGIRKLFAGPVIPRLLFHPGGIVLVPDVVGLKFQAVHSLDVARAFRAALIRDVHGAFNIAAEPVLDAAVLAETLRARRLRMSSSTLRRLVSLAWHLRLEPTSPGWVDMALSVPLMDTTRARRELDWSPRWSSTEALLSLLQGMSEDAGQRTPPLLPRGGRVASRRGAARA